MEYDLKSKSETSPETHDTTRTVRATKLVIVSSGTFGSPAILERSGIGSKTTLGRHGIVQVVELPGVGENFVGEFRRAHRMPYLLTEYTDHPFILVPFRTEEDAETLGGIIRGDPGEFDSTSAYRYKFSSIF